MVVATKPATVGELKASGYKVRSIREEMRHNLLKAIQEHREIFPGIIGYAETVIPQIENALILIRKAALLAEFAQNLTNEIQQSAKAGNVEDILKETNQGLNQLLTSFRDEKEDAKAQENQFISTARGAGLLGNVRQPAFSSAPPWIYLKP
jgi:hypothetical protein